MHKYQTIFMRIVIFTLAVLCLVAWSETWIIDQSGAVHRSSDSTTDYLVKADFNNTVNSTGWAFLRITTHPSSEDVQQFYHAGFIEGYLTRDLIYDAYRNYLGSVLNGNPEIDQRAQEFVTKQHEWMQLSCKAGGPLWDQVCNLMAQLEGLYEGYIESVKDSGNTEQFLDFNHFYYLTNMGDLEDIIPCYSSEYKKEMSCNSLLKLTKDGNIAMGHNTFNIYSLMLRVFKTYHFALHDPNVRSNISFSSRPGDLESKDDFFMMHESELVVVETSLNNYNRSNYQFMRPESLPTWVRVTIASRLASTPREWASIFELHRSGTHNNQWTVAKIEEKANLATDSVLLIEECFYLYKARDVTHELLEKNGYVASFNVPYDEEVFNRSDYRGSYPYNYWSDPRSIQFDELHERVTDAHSLGEVLRYNLPGKFDVCVDALSPRCDLQTGQTFGGIDGKVIDYKLMSQNKVLLISSPSYQNLEPFSWAKHQNIPHHGMPEYWKFPWFTYDQNSFTLEFHSYDE